ncbi:MAG: dUTP diphosphatase [Tissierellia bacterium]|nr:dUTP diphosphatase [Tissierellia bacterium]
MKIQILNKSKHGLPSYESIQASGLDLRANLDVPITLSSLDRIIVPTGLFLSMPAGVEAQVRARSGLAIKKGISLVNGIGTIDSDYRGEIGVLLVNLSSEEFTINDGDRIAQLVFCRYERIEWDEVISLDDTLRGDGGFGSSGIK